MMACFVDRLKERALFSRAVCRCTMNRPLMRNAREEKRRG